jgi:hypothetical protein
MRYKDDDPRASRSLASRAAWRRTPVRAAGFPVVCWSVETAKIKRCSWRPQRVQPRAPVCLSYGVRTGGAFRVITDKFSAPNSSMISRARVHAGARKGAADQGLLRSRYKKGRWGSQGRHRLSFRKTAIRRASPLPIVLISSRDIAAAWGKATHVVAIFSTDAHAFTEGRIRRPKRTRRSATAAAAFGGLF